MKIRLRSLLLASCTLLAAVSASAQIADLISVEKLTQYVQTTAGAPALATGAPGGAYRFDVAVNSLSGSITGITAPTVTLAAGSTAPGIITAGHNGGTLLLNGDEWRYGFPDAVGWSVASTGSLNSLFANGVYGVTVQGNTYSLDLDGAANDQAFFPPAIPTLTMSGGSWIGGKYVINVNQALTITTSNWTGFTSAGIGGLMNINLDGVGNEIVLSRLAPAALASKINEGASSATFTVAANTLTAGMDYDGFASFHRMVAQDTSQAGIFAVAWWGNETTFTISAIPEPSTYAAMAGALALGLVVWQRRRRATAA